MKKVLSFSLWGSNPTYTVGALENAKQCQELYPGWECWFYVHTQTVPPSIVAALRSLSHVTVIDCGRLPINNKSMLWRFQAIDDPIVELMMSRDTDTRILMREKLAVKDWLASNKKFHIMRDHPDHAYKILGGMFGTRKIWGFSWTSEIAKIPERPETRNEDQKFLERIVYPKILNDCVVHASFHKMEPFAKDFPIPFDPEFHHVGEYVYANGSRSYRHIQALKQMEKKKAGG